MIVYIDAGTGGMMLQVLLSGVAGGLIFFKLAAGRIFDFILRRRDGSAVADSADAPAPESADDESDRSLAA